MVSQRVSHPQEQMIVEMERAIHKRDVIALKLEPKATRGPPGDRGRTGSTFFGNPLGELGNGVFFFLRW